MKFEIDDKTGLLLIYPENRPADFGDDKKYREQLELILQAVIKTREKLSPNLEEDEE